MSSPSPRSVGRNSRFARFARDLLADTALGRARLQWLTLRVAGALRRGLESSESPGGLLDWGRKFLPAHFRLPPSRLHRWLADEFDALHRARGRKLNLIGPRGAAKSTVATLAGVLRAAVEARESYIWIVSDTRHQAAAHLENVAAELCHNRLLREAYPDSVPSRGGRLARGVHRNRIRLPNGVAIDAFGTGQRIRGTRHHQHRPTLIVCDDLQDDRHRHSRLLRRQSREWFHGALLRAGTATTNVIHLGTALHREALSVELHRTAGWRSRIFASLEKWPAEMVLWEAWERIYCDAEDPQAQDRARAFFECHRATLESGAEVLWPEAEDLYRLMCIRAESGHTAFQREKQSSPLDAELCEWPESYFDEGIWFEQWPRDLVIKTLALDPSKGRSDAIGDYSAFVLLGIDARGMIYLEADLARRPTPQIIADGVALYQRFRPDAFGIESNHFQELLGAEFEAELGRSGLVGVCPWAIDNRVSKPIRIRRWGPYLAARRVRFKADSPSTSLLVEQLRFFPAADHDDGPDAAEMALRLALELLAEPAAGDGLGSRLPLRT